MREMTVPLDMYRLADVHLKDGCQTIYKNVKVYVYRDGIEFLVKKDDFEDLIEQIFVPHSNVEIVKFK